MDTNITNINETVEDLNKAVNLLSENIKESLSKKFPVEGASGNKNTGFDNFLRKGYDELYTKSLSSASDNPGSLLVPHDVCTHIYDNMNVFSPVRFLAKSLKISTEALDVLVDQQSPEAAWSAEEQFPEVNDKAEFKKIKIPAHEIFAKIKATQKLLDDSSMDIYDWFTKKIAKQIAIVENKAFLHGDGNGKPKGILSYETSADESEFGRFQHFTTGAVGSFPKENGGDILISVVGSLPREYVKNAVWLVSRSAFAAVQKLKDSVIGRYIWQPSLSSAPSTLLGYDVIVDDDLPELSAADGSISMIFGDFSSAYQIADRKDLEIFRDPYSSKPFVEFYATKRTGGDVINFDALKMVKFSQE